MWVCSNRLRRPPSMAAAGDSSDIRTIIFEPDDAGLQHGLPDTRREQHSSIFCATLWCSG